MIFPKYPHSSSSPSLSIVPFGLFIYWKYETRLSRESDHCGPSNHLRHRNALLTAAVLVFYWLRSTLSLT
ncbi:hypothetical protein RHMOL_Rhmol11G0126000 [Rhododendron molle]|uniref:Uncharacterized protein n=1 Tax=Rhododendron molle TaxID=49168 RepID=A0ACC0LRD8_RHOML|nr:hypothetical protein RHMOL_Rhmol11G0126000 [Rhododendron molle]